MKDAIARAIGIKRQTPYIRAFMERSNMEVMRRLTPVIAVLSVLVLLSTFTDAVLWHDTTPEIMLCYRTEFIAMAAVAVLFRCLSNTYLNTPNPKALQGEYLLIAFVALIVGLNLWITVADFATMGRYFFLLVALFTLFGLFFIRPWVSLVILGIVFMGTLGGLGLVGLLAPVQAATLLSYLLVIMIVSFSNYAARLQVGKTNEQIVSASRHDELTGILNRRAFDEDSSTFVGLDLYLIMADVDEFKYYNDWYGHAMGDQLLTGFAACMAEAFGADRTYRFGGDEFIAVFQAKDPDDARERIQAWQESFSKGTASVREFELSCSVGCVHGRVADEAYMHDMLRIADVLLYRSRGSGRVTLAEYSVGLLREAIVNASVYGVPDEGIDAMTGLLTSEFFVSHAAEAAPSLLERGQSVDFVYVNVSNLKDYNSRYGFTAGDELIKSVAQTLHEVFPGRLLAHFGDDRFVIMTEDEGLIESLERATSLVEHARRGTLISLRAGVYRYLSADESVRHACDCARMACESLRGHYDVRYRYYTEELGDRMERHHRVLERFETALEQGHIQPYYQPIVRVAGDQVCEFEILARWNDPEVGMLSPADFIPALEEAYLIHRLDLYIVEQVCRNFCRWSELGLAMCPVSVNFSRHDFEACDLASEVIGLLDRYGLPHYLIRVEVTESAFAQDGGNIRQSLEQFQEAGMQVWMDDFGSGYSTLNTLREWKFDLIKFDMSFLRGMNARDRNDPSVIMLTKLVEMAKELGLQTLIEGVETIDQLLFLRAIAFEKLQGFVFDKPGPFEEMCQHLDNWTYIIEPAQKRMYYEAIGKVNLMQPVEPDASFNPFGVVDGTPVAVLEYEDGEVHYLQHNEAYLKRLSRMGIAGVLESESLLNTPTEERAMGVHAAIEAVRDTDSWVTVTQHDGSPGYARCIARVPEANTYAFLYFTAPVE